MNYYIYFLLFSSITLFLKKFNKLVQITGEIEHSAQKTLNTSLLMFTPLLSNYAKANIIPLIKRIITW